MWGSSSRHLGTSRGLGGEGSLWECVREAVCMSVGIGEGVGVCV